MVKIYTKTGDGGTTSLFGGKRVDKNTIRIGAYGEVDELNSLIGVIIAEQSLSSHPEPFASLKGKLRERSRDSSVEPQNDKNVVIAKKLLRIQEDLFVLGTDLSSPLDVKINVPRITRVFITRLEREIDAWEKNLPKLRNFILPGGSSVGARLHLARTVARRAERSIVDLASSEKVNVNAQVYINRLSDWLFVLARYINKIEGGKEIIWKGRS